MVRLRPVEGVEVPLHPVVEEAEVAQSAVQVLLMAGAAEAAVAVEDRSVVRAPLAEVVLEAVVQARVLVLLLPVQAPQRPVERRRMLLWRSRLAWEGPGGDGVPQWVYWV